MDDPTKTALARAGVIEGVAPIDDWSFIHFSFGCLMGKVGLPLLPAVGLMVLYEYIENANNGRFRESVFGKSGAESVKNSIADVLIGIAGYYVGRAI